MGQWVRSRARVTLLIAIGLTAVAWGRLAVVGFTNPSPMREMRVAGLPDFPNTNFSCLDTAISIGHFLYRPNCQTPSLVDTATYLVRFDMARGVMDAAWSIPDQQMHNLANELVEFKTNDDGSVDVGFAANAQTGNSAAYYRLLPNNRVESIDPPAGDPPRAVLIGPAGEPASTGRLAQATARQRWLPFNVFTYSVDAAGRTAAAEIRTSHIAAAPENFSLPGLKEYNIVPLGGRRAVVEAIASPTAFSAGSLVVSDDGTGRTAEVLMVPPPGDLSDFLMAMPDADGGLWVFGPMQTYAHFDSELRRTDGLNLFERFGRMAVDNFRIYSNSLWFLVDRNSVYKASLVPFKQAALPLVLLGLPVGALIAAWFWRRRTAALPEPFVDSPELRWAALVSIGLCVVFGYWFWLLTAYY